MVNTMEQEVQGQTDSVIRKPTRERSVSCNNDNMVTKRQHAVNILDADLDDALAVFVADVVELGGLFRRLADTIARGEGQTQSVWYALSVFSADSHAMIGKLIAQASEPAISTALTARHLRASSTGSSLNG